jgi:multidrug efflux pump subunit AcrB
MERTMASLEEGLVLSILAIVLLLAANFQSIREPLAVLMMVPAVLAGVVLALFITQTTINVQSMMGAIMAIGVSVANAVLMVTFAKDKWFAGEEQKQAATLAARSRLRPILMTSLAMVVGMIPTAAAIGEGGEQSAPLGRAVIGGLLASTVATLVFLPAIYVAFGPRGKARSPSLDPDDAEPVDAHRGDQQGARA